MFWGMSSSLRIQLCFFCTRSWIFLYGGGLDGGVNGTPQERRTLLHFFMAGVPHFCVFCVLDIYTPFQEEG